MPVSLGRYPYVRGTYEPKNLRRFSGNRVSIMMGTANYRFASEVFAETRDLALDALSPLLSMRDAINNSDVNEQDRNRLQLKAMIESTYSHIVAKHVRPGQRVLNAIRALNRHVLDYYNHTNIDDFLEEQFLEVPVSFAFLSDLAGYPITIIGDSSARFKDIDALFQNIELPFNRIGWSNA